MIVLTCTLTPHEGRADDARAATLDLMRESVDHVGLLRYFWTEDEGTHEFHLVEVHENEASVFNHVELADVSALVDAGSISDIHLYGDAPSPRLRELMDGFGGASFHPTVAGGSSDAAPLAGATGGRHRRIVIGTDAQGRSAVVADAHDLPHSLRPNGALIQDVWRIEQVPADPTQDGAVRGELVVPPPPSGAVIRLLSLPPDADKGRYGADPATTAPPTMGKADTVHVGVVVSGRAYLILEAEEVLLSQGDTFALQASPHTWRNPFDREFVMALTGVPRLPEA